jgi:hypothetical protein
MPNNTDPGNVGPGTNPNPNPDSVARKKFEENVYPIIKGSGTSDCFSCHSAAGPSGNVTGFVAPDLADAYATVTSYQIVVGNFAPSAAGILTKIGAGNIHQGRTYTPDQIAKITDWLNTEVSERSNNPTQPPASGGNETYAAATARVLNQWSGCMTSANFQTANMANAFGNMQANNGETCRSCHSTGGYGFMATTIAETTNGGPPGLFTTMSTNQYYLVMYYSVDLSDTTRGTDGKLTNAKMKVNLDSFKGVATQQAPHVQHPSFNYQQNQMVTALNTFYTSTMAAVTAGNCGPTKLDPPAQ